MIINRNFVILLIFMSFLSCKKKDNVLFNISLQDTYPTSIVEFQDNIFVSLTYSHNEGFVGFADPDRLSLEIKDSRLDSADYYHLIPVHPPNQSLSVTGEIVIEIDAPFIFGNGMSETLSYSIRIQDSEMQWSNVVVTPSIIVNK
tara:strand:- start:62 stop:496 length:435 start_codon:yes stop_codon:yes gene_type:complete